MRFFFGSHGSRFAFHGIIQTGLLVNRTAVFNNSNLALRLVINRLLNEPHRVHILDFAPCPQNREIIIASTELFVGSSLANRHIYVCTHRSFLHISITSAQISQNLTQFSNIFGCFLRPANIGTRDDFHQRNTCPVKVHERHFRVHIMHRLARVLFNVDTFDTNLTRYTWFHIN